MFTKRPISPLKKALNRQQARMILRLGGYASEEEIRARFKSLVHANHTDGQQDPNYKDTVSLEKLIWAKDTLLEGLKE